MILNHHHNVSDKAEILKEIFLSPSEKTIADNFSNEAANCSGKCSSGICRTLV